MLNQSPTPLAPGLGTKEEIVIQVGQLVLSLIPVDGPGGVTDDVVPLVNQSLPFPPSKHCPSQSGGVISEKINHNILEAAKITIPNRKATVWPSDKSWYNNELKKSRQQKL